MHRFRAGTIGFCVLAALAVLGCEGRNDRADDADTGIAAGQPITTDSAAGALASGANTVRVADLMENPDRYIGQTVTVEADLEEVHSAYAFSLDEDAPLAGGIDNDLLVFSPKSAQLANIDDQWLNNRVRVRGTVRQVNLVEVEREIGWDLDRKIEMDLEGRKVVLLASNVERLGAR